MTTNDLISLIIKNHMNADCLAQIASAVECLQEQLADVEAVRESVLTHRVKVYPTDGGKVEYIKCVSLEDAEFVRRRRIQEGGVKLALIGTREEMAELSKMFGD